jgi:hypothetical protein
MPSVSDELHVRVKNPRVVKGKKILVATKKGTVRGNVEEAMVQRTIQGEAAELEIKTIRGSDGRVEFVHIHCMKDHESSSWYKSSGLPVDRFYDISKDDDALTITIRCKKCDRIWDASGRMKN